MCMVIRPFAVERRTTVRRLADRHDPPEYIAVFLAPLVKRPQLVPTTLGSRPGFLGDAFGGRIYRSVAGLDVLRAPPILKRVVLTHYMFQLPSIWPGSSPRARASWISRMGLLCWKS